MDVIFIRPSRILTVAVVLFAVIMAFSVPMYSGETNVSIDQMIRGQKFFQDEGNMELQRMTSGLSADQRSQIYNKYEKNTGLIFLGNFFVVGLGSWLAGDRDWALTSQLMMAGGLITTAISLFGAMTVTLNGDTSHQVNGLMTALLVAGICLTSAAEIVNLTIPFTYSDFYNDQLRKGLNLTAKDQWNRTGAFALITEIPFKKNLIEITVFQAVF
jgi:hypothetical protein